MMARPPARERHESHRWWEVIEYSNAVGVGLLGMLITVLGNLPWWLFIQWWWHNFALPSQLSIVCKSVMTAVGTGLLGAAFVLAFGKFIEVWYDEKKVKPFEEFWGQKLKSGSAGRILLQEDSISTLCIALVNARGYDASDEKQRHVHSVIELLEKMSGSNESAGKENRTYKARKWINRCDTEGAKVLREEFAKKRFIPPKLDTIKRLASPPEPNEEVDAGADSSCDIYMGLGYTEYIFGLVNDKCKDVLKISFDSRHGDVIDLHHHYFPKSGALNPTDTKEHSRPEDLHRDFMRLIPNGWDHEKYIALENDSEPTMWDYAYIFRYKEKGKPKVCFHIGGFTEYGTWAAAHYLAKHWEEILRSCVRPYEGNDESLTVIILAGKIPFHTERQRAAKGTKSAGRWDWIMKGNLVGKDFVPKFQDGSLT